MDTTEILLIAFGCLIFLLLIFYVYVKTFSYSKQYLSRGKAGDGRDITLAEDVPAGAYQVDGQIYTKGLFGRFWPEKGTSERY